MDVQQYQILHGVMALLKSVQCPADESAVFIERRSGKDRRQNRFDVFHPFQKTRRRQMRRKSDRCRIFLLDYYHSRIFIMVVLVLLLSLMDALLTLWLLNDGATELNPVMAYFLGFGPTVFIVVKHLITSISVVIVVLLYHTQAKGLRFQLGHLLYFFAACFGAVILWEITLLQLHL